MTYDRSASAVQRGASRWHPVQLSESQALRAIAEGGMVIDAPDGQSIPVRYERRIEHSNGNWTWVGRAGKEGRPAVLTFGENAVFGLIPNGSKEPLQLTTASGRTWLVQSDSRVPAAANTSREADFLVAPELPPLSAVTAAAMKRALGSKEKTAVSATAVTAATVVDVVLGYTNGLATRLGGQSQALTRLNFLVDLTNQAYADSQVDAQIRLVNAVQVDYPDATSNQTALFELTGVSCTTSNSGSLRLPDRGVNCTPATRPAALEPLIDAREQYGADLVSLIRDFNSANGSCGTGWLLGAAQTDITSASADFAFSVVSDDGGSNCREDYLAHQMGHNMGLQHDRETAQGSDDTNTDGNLLDPEEFGRFPYTFGYVAGADAGNFYTVMSIRRSGLTRYLVFSNPNITICGGFTCGVADQADNARGLEQTIPVVATFRATVVPLGRPDRDYNGDGQSDILWRNSSDGRNTIWRSGNSSTQSLLTTVSGQTWKVVGSGDFNGDGSSDVLWRNSSNGRNTIWLSGSSATQQPVATVADQAWKVAGTGDFDGDGQSDILWRNSRDGRNTIWRSGNGATQQAVATVSLSWAIVGAGDFNGDGSSDILWRNSGDGRNSIWLSGSSATQQAVTTVGDQGWKVAGAADFNGDGHADILWRNSRDGRNTIWLSGSSATQQAVTTVGDQNWKVVSTGDFNGDGDADILWRNSRDGRNTIWLSGSSATQQATTAVTSQAWVVVG